MPLISSPFSPPGVTQGGVKVILAGVDVTHFIDELSIDIKDTLGQGAGSGSGASPRASTFSLLSTLGPAATAVGSGTHVTTPQLVRNGDIVIYDANNNPVFGGLVTKITDMTDRTTIYTRLEGVDYFQAFARTIVNQIFSGMDDVAIIKALLTAYAPYIHQSKLPAKGTMIFSTKNYRNKTLLQCLTDVIDSTGFQSWVDPLKFFYYESPGAAQTAPFGLSNEPNYTTSFQLGIDSYEIDDTAVINRVYFYGGRKPSNDFVQDISTQGNGNNTTFVLAYYPRNASDGKIHVYLNGVEQALGFVSGTKISDKFISQGGTAQVILNADAHTLTFDVAPAAGSTITCKYRYELPLMVVLSSASSVTYYGEYLDGTLSDETVVDSNIAVQRCRVLLVEQAYGLTTLKLRCWRAGLRSGMSIRIDHSIRQIHNSFIIQEVDVVPKGNGFFEYNVTCGAWNWNMVDILNHVISATQVTDDATAESANPIDDMEQTENFHISFAVTATSKNFGGYYARATTLNDGHDAYCGFCSITS